MTRQIQVCSRAGGLMISTDRDEISRLFEDKSSEVSYIIKECEEKNIDVWYFTGDPFKAKKLMKTTQASPQETAKILIHSQTGSLPGKPKRISKHKIIAEFFEEEGLR